MSGSESRRRFITATARLLRERGFHATSMADIVTESGAPKGSLYFLYPGGKDDLVADAVGSAGEEMCVAMRRALASPRTVRQGFDTILSFLAADLSKSDFRVGCPIGTVAAEAPEAPAVRQRLASVFDTWHAAIRERLVVAGLRERRATELATLSLVMIEGAIVLAKAKRSIEPLETVKRELARALGAELVTRRRAGRRVKS
jgi:TetR/AcrR family transcriptional regulator, lmrAB and yxaGH operons repressor